MSEDARSIFRQYIVESDLKGAQSMARLLKKAGTSKDNASKRIKDRYKLSDAELRSVLIAVWGR